MYMYVHMYTVCMCICRIQPISYVWTRRSAINSHLARTTHTAHGTHTPQRAQARQLRQRHATLDSGTARIYGVGELGLTFGATEAGAPAPRLRAVFRSCFLYNSCTI